MLLQLTEETNEETQNEKKNQRITLRDSAQVLGASRGQVPQIPVPRLRQVDDADAVIRAVGYSSLGRAVLGCIKADLSEHKTWLNFAVFFEISILRTAPHSTFALLFSLR